MPTAQSRANLKYYHKRASSDPEYGARIAETRMERYYLNQEEEKERARLRYHAKKERVKALIFELEGNLPAEKVEEISA